MSREEFLKQAIKDNGYNLKDFAKKIDMPYTTLLSIVNSSVGGASVDNIIKICNGLNLDIEKLNPKKTANNLDCPILEKYKKLNSIGRQKVEEYINDLLNSGRYNEEYADEVFPQQA